MRSRRRMYSAVMRLFLKCLRIGQRRRFWLTQQVEQLWLYGHLCLRSLFYNSFADSDTALDALFEPIYWLVDHVTRWFGVVFVALVITLTTSVVGIVYICLLPMILQTYPIPWIFWHVIYGHWNLVMIVFHYYMAITTQPGYPPQHPKNDLAAVSICRKCIAPKPARTHHCSICNRCVLKMDHHCRILLQTYSQTPPPTFSFRQRAFHKSIVYAWVLCSSVALALGALMLWHSALITRGETSIERHINRKEKKRLQKKSKMFRNPYSFGPLGNWKVFLGVERQRHWITRVLLPSPHPPYGSGFSWETPPYVVQQKTPLLAI
ncbi:palmitoyltransferase ZDHHC16 isoform X4 [Ahaetulla prasina]|uniref:palmitoyltransferase ZDHHC16 isoform X4 n=1 Tax=Ahaetulla prasina TaxID=499056 RepID=UPI0026498887|nr:palmitoyltransferase ZDHHC16 isoform X4 [Ahaetulla prasina]